MSSISDSVLPISYKKTKQKRTGKKLLFESTSDDQGSSSDESLTAPSRRPAASLVWKRSLTSYDDEDENPHNCFATPSPVLQKSNKRRRSSSKTRQMRKKLEEYRANREKSAAKKKLHLNYPQKNPTLTYSSSEDESACPVSKKGSPIILISSSSKEELTSPDSKKEGPILISSDSEEYLSTPNSKDGNSQDEEGPILISSDSEEDLSTPNSKDGSSQDEDDATLGDFIVPNSDCSSQDVDWRAHISVEDLILFWKPTKKEAFEIFVQGVVIKLLLDDDGSLGCLESIMNGSPHHVAAAQKVEKLLESKKSLVTSNRWDPKFTDELKKKSALSDEELPRAFEGTCQACQLQRDISRWICLENDNEETMEFLVGKYCADRAIIYHEIHHFCDVKLKKNCQEKMPDLRKVSLTDRVIDGVREYCESEEQQKWMNDLFKDYEELIDKADQWATDGREYKRMKTAILSYMY